MSAELICIWKGQTKVIPLASDAVSMEVIDTALIIITETGVLKITKELLDQIR